MGPRVNELAEANRSPNTTRREPNDKTSCISSSWHSRTFLALRATLFDENGTTITPGAIIAQILTDEEHCIHVSCSTNAASTRTDNSFMLQV
jgi:hypothetical protein